MPSITVLDTRPTYITPSEHAALSSSTPSSFSDIPTVVRHVEEGVRVVIEPPEAIAKLGIQEEKLRHGTLLVLESALTFVFTDPNSSSDGTPTQEDKVGISVEYPRITLHAVSRTASGSVGPCIYCQLDDIPEEGQNTNNENEGEGEDEEEVGLVELKIVPKDQASLDPIFEALSQCASLHPDPASPSSPNGFNFGDFITEDNLDEAFVDADVELIQEIMIGNENPEGEEAETGRVYSDYVNNSRYAPY